LRFVLVGWVIGCGSTHPSDGIAGRYAFHWQASQPTPFWVMPELRMSDGTVDVGEVNQEEIRLAFNVPGYALDPVTANWTGTDWQTLVVVTAQTGSSETETLVIRWTPGGTCVGTIGRGLDENWPGACMFTREGP
jgi:hypothetical protein